MANSSHTPPFLPKLQHHLSNSTQLFGLLTLLITATISTLLTGLTAVLTALLLILFSPLIILFSPIWLPPCLLLFFVTAAFLSLCGFTIVTVAMLSWVHRYFRRSHRSLGSDRVDSASHVKEHGREYEYSDGGGYWQGSRVKYAAPGA